MIVHFSFVKVPKHLAEESLKVVTLFCTGWMMSCAGETRGPCLTVGIH